MNRTAAERELRSKLIRLAHANPDLRPHLLPLLEKEARGDLGTDCYKQTKRPRDPDYEPKDTAGDGTCYRLHNEYGKADSYNKAEYNKKYREKWQDSPSISRTELPDGYGDSFKR